MYSLLTTCCSRTVSRTESISVNRTDILSLLLEYISPVDSGLSHTYTDWTPTPTNEYIF